LADLQAIDSYAASDLRAFVKFMVGDAQPYIISGLRVVGASGRDVTIEVKNCAIFLPNDTAGSFFIGGPSDDDQILSIPANSTVYVEASFSRVTQTPVTKGRWDETATTGAYPAGQEFTSSVDAQEVLKMTISFNTVDFTPGSIPIARFNTASGITSHSDCRNMFFRLGTGGVSPNPTRQYGWSPNRAAAPVTGTAYGDTAGSPFQRTDAYGVVNDSAFTCFKDFHDALLTVIAEMRGVSIWYTSGALSAYIANLNLNQLMFDSPGGHHMVADPATRLTWSRAADGKLRSEGTGPVQWLANYGFVSWQLGGTFTSASVRTYSAALFNITVPDGSNLYLGLIRDVVVGAGNTVEWLPATNDSGWPTSETVKGVAGDFLGIAVGDYIRKESESASRYYKVAALYDTITGIEASDGAVAGANVTEVRLDRTIAVATAEPLRYFRARYDTSYLVVDDAASRAAGTYNDSAYYWIGRRTGTEFVTREYGSFSVGESRLTGDDSSAPLNRQQEPINMQFARNVRFVGGKLQFVSAAGAYTDTPVTTLISLRRRSMNMTSVFTDTVWALRSTGGTGDLTFSSDGDTLWVKLTSNDGSSHNLTADTVDDEAAVDCYEVRLTGAAPTNVYANRDAYRLCSRRTYSGVDYLEFYDGSILGPNGWTTKADMEALGSVVMSASQTHKYKVVSGGALPYVVNYQDDYMIGVVTNSGVRVVTLPTLATADLKVGTVFRIKDVDGTASGPTAKIQVVTAEGVTTFIDGGTGDVGYDIDAAWAEFGFMKIDATNWAVV
jgi:hypothetical protein